MNSSPGRGIVQLPPIDGPAPRAFDIRKYKTAATTLLRSGRINELRKLNRTLPTCSLPTEILQRIFIACAQFRVDLPTWSWVDITFVCSIWRQAALDCYDLWSHIDFSHPRWASLTLHRAQMLPISVQANVEAVNQHSLHRTLQFAPMIRDIHLVSSIYNIGPLIGTLKNPNRSLESLIVEVLRPDDNQDIRYSKRSISGNGPPLLALKHLELHRTPISLISPRFTGLTNLSLHHLPFSERPARQDFLALLERFQMLKHLTLVRAFPKNIVAGGHTSGRSIRLPNLITVSLTGSVQELVNMLECITLQPAGRLHCHVDRLGDFKTNFWRLAKVIGSHFHDAAWAMPLDTLVMTGREDGLRFTNDHEMSPLFQQTLRIRAFGVTGTVEPLLDLVIGPDVHTSHDEVIVATLGSMWDALPLTYVHTLTLQSLDVITQKSWPRLLTALHSLRVIDIGGRPPSGLIWALFLNARSHSHLEHDDLSSILLPKLEDIYLHNVDCHAGGLMVSSSAPINSHYDLDDSQFLEVLYAYFEDRQRCTLDLRSLSISRCQNVSNQILNDLRGTVSYLSWDNRGLFKGDINSRSPATYRTHWPSKPPTLRHYFRLCTLLGSD